jgi:hypothetical protein
MIEGFFVTMIIFYLLSVKRANMNFEKSSTLVVIYECIEFALPYYVPKKEN